MNSISGLWNNYRQGEVYRALEAIIDGLVKRGYHIHASSIGPKKRIASGQEFLQMMKGYEQKQGLENLLELFWRGLGLEAIKGKEARPVRDKTPKTSALPSAGISNGIKVSIEVYLRMPEESEDRRNLFKEMIVNWFASQKITFSEKFFKHSREKFLPHQLEMALKRSFGFQFNYKILMSFEETAGGKIG